MTKPARCGLSVECGGGFKAETNTSSRIMRSRTWLAEEAGIHRNTISNHAAGKFNGDPGTVAAVGTALEAAGAEFINGIGRAA